MITLHLRRQPSHHGVCEHALMVAGFREGGDDKKIDCVLPVLLLLKRRGASSTLTSTFCLVAVVTMGSTA
jgi:hypothetical protein